jgi:hypothetical protein
MEGGPGSMPRERRETGKREHPLRGMLMTRLPQHVAGAQLTGNPMRH